MNGSHYPQDNSRWESHLFCTRQKCRLLGRFLNSAKGCLRPCLCQIFQYTAPGSKYLYVPLWFACTTYMHILTYPDLSIMAAKKESNVKLMSYNFNDISIVFILVSYIRFFCITEIPSESLSRSPFVTIRPNSP